MFVFKQLFTFLKACCSIVLSVVLLRVVALNNMKPLKLKVLTVDIPLI